MLERYLERNNNLYISLGEDGIVVAYFVGETLSKKFFIRSTSEQDTVELRKILINDPDAKIRIYLDVMDQSYVQKSLPAISAFSINSLAFKRLEKDTPPNHLKSCLQVSKSEVGRKDWVYIFISSALEQPISTWITFFERYQNIIYGIHFLPVEMGNVIKCIKQALMRDKTKEEIVLTPMQKMQLMTSKWFKKEESSIWDVFVTLNKSGGFRQAVYQNGKVIFTRLLNSIVDPNADVIAGNIEQEITNSLEYLRRLSLREKDEVNIYMIISSDIKKHIRKNKFNTQEIHILTPYEASQLLNLGPNITKDNDRFADPVLLAVMHKVKRHIITVFSPETKKIFFYTKIFRSILVSLKLLVPFVLLSMVLNISDIIGAIGEIKLSESKKDSLSNTLNDTSKSKNTFERKFGINIDIDQIQEIVEYYNNFKKYDTFPLPMLQKLGKIKPDITRIKELDIKYVVPHLIYIPKPEVASSVSAPPVAYSSISKYEVVFKNFGTTLEELQRHYKEYNDQLSKSFPDYKRGVTSLPDNFSFDDIKKPFLMQLTLAYPKETVIETNKQLSK